jgi:Uma2 family endonuclease
MTRSRIDLLLKHNRYAAAGVAHYWVVDPAEPSVVAYRLDDTGNYAEVATVRGDDTYDATEPFPVSVVPCKLVTY